MIFTSALKYYWEATNLKIEIVGLGPYPVSDNTKKGLVTLNKKNDKELKKDFPEDKINQSGDDCIENPIGDLTW